MKNTVIMKIRHMSIVRDLGGLQTLHGDIIKYNILYRTSKLSKIKKKQENNLKNIYNISKVIDLRTKEEIEAFPDVYINDVDYYNYPVLSDYDNPVVKHGNLRSTLNKIMKMEGGSKGYLKSCYRKLAVSDLALENYHNLMVEIANSTDPILYHCTQGKDRTGVATMILLLILGVSEEAIIKDYLKYNKVGKLKRLFIYIGVSLLKFSVKAAKEVQNLLIARKEYAEEVFNSIKNKFNTFDNYIKEGLKLDDTTINKLKEKFLEKKVID